MKIEIPEFLRDRTNGAEVIMVNATNMAEALEQLTRTNFGRMALMRKKYW